MATSAIKKPDLPFTSTGAFRKYGRVVTLSAITWANKDIGIPEGYRPTGTTFSYCEQRTVESGVYGVGRIQFSRDGVITLTGSNNEFLGAFSWIT